MSRREVEHLYVVKPFKKLIKQKALDEDMTVLEWTEHVASMANPFEEIKNKKDKRGYKFETF